MNRFRLTVVFPLNVETMIEDTKRVDSIVGREHWAAGSGFAQRDVEYDFPTREERAKAIIRVLEVPNNEYEILTDVDDE